MKTKVNIGVLGKAVDLYLHEIEKNDHGQEFCRRTSVARDDS